MTPDQRERRRVRQTFGESVYIFNSVIWHTPPVFHGWGAYVNGIGPVTVCRRRVQHSGVNVAIILPSFHAVKFAIPCQRCFGA